MLEETKAKKSYSSAKKQYEQITNSMLVYFDSLLLKLFYYSLKPCTTWIYKVYSDD